MRLKMTCLHLDVALEGEKRQLKLLSLQFKVPSQLSGTTKKDKNARNIIKKK